jgi:hypothetical protein
MPNQSLTHTRKAHRKAKKRPSRGKATEERAPSRGSMQALAYGPTIVALPAIGFGIAGLLGSGPRFLRRHPIVSAALACGGMVALFKSQFDRFLLEHPHYELEQELDGLEVRRYAPRKVAETVVEATSFDDARKEAFHRLAGYIFGANAPSEKLPMTTPVSMARAGSEPSGEHLAMTTPVTLSHSPKGYVMRFQMPKDRLLSSLPKPTDARVRLRQLPGERVAVLRFRGTYDADRIAEKQRELLERVAAAGLTASGEAVFAGYDSPAALPFLRRVEVWVPVG